MRGWARLTGGRSSAPRLPMFTVAPGASADDLRAVHRACLRAVRGRLDELWVDLTGSQDWPDEARGAAYRLVGGRRHAVGVDVADDLAFTDAVTVSPFCLSVDGIGEGRLVYSAADEGSGLVVELAAREHRAAEDALRRAGHDPRYLAHLPR